MLIKINNGRYVNPDMIVSMEINHSEGRESILSINLTNGQQYSVAHRPHSIDGIDIYTLQQEILTRVVDAAT
jgi:hypothetical protein